MSGAEGIDPAYVMVAGDAGSIPAGSTLSEDDVGALMAARNSLEEAFSYVGSVDAVRPDGIAAVIESLIRRIDAMIREYGAGHDSE